eukprot:NODE_136_length_18060_cov_0.656645.p8 type:complete len:239 gc:universal NODE_136_length_18060_cov_0.656645:9387-10103(+)
MKNKSKQVLNLVDLYRKRKHLPISKEYRESSQFIKIAQTILKSIEQITISLENGLNGNMNTKQIANQLNGIHGQINQLQTLSNTKEQEKITQLLTSKLTMPSQKLANILTKQQVQQSTKSIARQSYMDTTTFEDTTPIDGDHVQLLMPEEPQQDEAMNQIQNTLHDLSSVFGQLGQLLSTQREQIQRIHSNIDDMDMNIEGAHTELLTYMNSISSNRSLLLKVFGLLLFITLAVIYLS